MSINTVKMAALAALGTFGAFIATLFGGWGEDMITLLIFMGTDYIRPAVIIAFCANELISIIENLGIMGVPLPTVIVRAMDILQSRTDTGANKKRGRERDW